LTNANGNRILLLIGTFHCEQRRNNAKHVQRNANRPQAAICTTNRIRLITGRLNARDRYATRFAMFLPHHRATGSQVLDARSAESVWDTGKHWIYPQDNALRDSIYLVEQSTEHEDAT
jgi:hypothetical protein